MASEIETNERAQKKLRIGRSGASSCRSGVHWGLVIGLSEGYFEAKSAVLKTTAAWHYRAAVLHPNLRSACVAPFWRLEL